MATASAAASETPNGMEPKTDVRVRACWLRQFMVSPDLRWGPCDCAEPMRNGRASQARGWGGGASV